MVDSDKSGGWSGLIITVCSASTVVLIVAGVLWNTVKTLEQEDTGQKLAASVLAGRVTALEQQLEAGFVRMEKRSTELQAVVESLRRDIINLTVTLARRGLPAGGTDSPG